MKINKKMCKVIADIEYLIGSECYNPNSYDGWNDIEGCDFRYPINVPNSDGEYVKTRSKITESYAINKKDITPDAIRYMKYRFGSNELMIGMGIIKALEYLESRYGIDFNELEKSKKSNK